MTEPGYRAKQRILDEIHLALVQHRAPRLSDRQRKQWLDASARVLGAYTLQGVLVRTGRSQRDIPASDLPPPELRMDCELALLGQQLRGTLLVS